METRKNIGICKEGFVFGQLEYDNTWLINKTFVSHQIANRKKHQFAEKLMALVQDDLIAELAAKDFNAAKYLRTKEVLTELKRA